MSTDPITLEDRLTPAGLLIQSLGHDVDLVGQLQHIHDGADVVRWEDRFEELAAEEGLTYTPPVHA